MQLLGTSELDLRASLLALGGWSLNQSWTEQSWPRFRTLWTRYLVLNKNPAQFSLEVLGPGATARPEGVRTFFFRAMTLELIHRAAKMPEQAHTLVPASFRRELDSLLFLERLWARDLTVGLGGGSDLWRERFMVYVALLLMIDQFKSGFRRSSVLFEVDREMTHFHLTFARCLPIGDIPSKGLSPNEWRAIKRTLEEIGSYFEDRARGEHDLVGLYQRLRFIVHAQRLSIDGILQR